MEILENCANSGIFLSDNLAEIFDAQLWRIHQDQPSIENIENLTALLSTQEQTRAAAFRFALHRRRFIVRRAALRQILAATLGCPPQDLVFEANPHGKPCLPGLQFNLSTSAAYAVCVLSQAAQLGVDIEQQRPLADLQGMARICLTLAEYAVFQSLPDQNSAFFTWWTAKEAALKALGLGLGGGLKNIEFDWNNQTLHLVPQLAQAFPPLFYHHFSLAPGYFAAVASTAPISRFAFREWAG